jgi:Family of unknown function (DUF5985)
MLEFLAGAVALCYLLAAVHFLRFWKKTRDRLFLHFAVAFGLFMVNQIATSAFAEAAERTGYAYVLRVLGYALILFAIVDKNTFPLRKRP